MLEQSHPALVSAAAHRQSARELFHNGQCDAALAAYNRARDADLGDVAPTLLARHWGKSVRAQDLHDVVAPTPPLRTFLRFMGETPFTPNEWFAFMMEEIEARKVEWISTLAENHHGLWPLEDVIPGARCLTMGPLEGALEWRLAGLGADAVVALEGYLPNYLKCHALKALFPSLPMEFVQADVEATDLPAGFDTIFCPGVLYHLSEPHRLLQKIRALEPRLFFLMTQLAFEPSHPANAVRKLGDETVVRLEGRSYRGRLFVEDRSGQDYVSGLDAMRPSFWFYPDELRRLLIDLGFVLQDHSVVDLQQLGVAGLYACSAPGARSPVRLRIKVLPRLQRVLMRLLMRLMSKDRKLSMTTFRG